MAKKQRPEVSLRPCNPSYAWQAGLTAYFFDGFAFVVADVCPVCHDETASDAVAREVYPPRHGVHGLVLGAVVRRRVVAIAAWPFRVEASGMDEDIGDIFDNLQVCGDWRQVWFVRDRLRVTVIFDNHVDLRFDVDDDAVPEPAYHVAASGKMVV